MYASRIVEVATVEDLFDRPRHPYTEGLFRSVPKLDNEAERLATIPGTVPNPARFPSGCKFHTRCPKTRALAAESGAADVINSGSGEEAGQVMRICVNEEPSLRAVQDTHWAACHFTENYAQSPVTTPTLDHRREVIPDVLDAAEGVAAGISIMQETPE
jgi:oligopeptide/dipeptide ABC transporter ATP-binding protein